MKPHKPDKKTFYYRVSIAALITVSVLSIVLFVFNVFPISKSSYTITYLDGITRIEYENGDIIEYPNNLSDTASSDKENEPQIASVHSYDITTPENEIINVNTASSEELQTLKGIGETKAAAIIEYRTTNGGFKTIEEIIRVKGIGEATLEKIRDKITV